MRLTPELEQAIQGIARKVAKRVPWLHEDLVQEGLLTLHLLEPDATVKRVDAWARQACANRMVDYLRSRRHCWRELVDMRPNRRQAGLATAVDLALEEDEPWERSRGDQRVWDRRRIQWDAPWPVVDTDALDAVVSVGLVLDRLPLWDRTLLAMCFGVVPVPGAGTLSDVAKAVGLNSEATVRYHRDRIIKSLQEASCAA